MQKWSWNTVKNWRMNYGCMLDKWEKLSARAADVWEGKERKTEQATEQSTARPYTGNLLHLSQDRNAEMFWLEWRNIFIINENENAVRFPVNWATGFISEQVSCTTPFSVHIALMMPLLRSRHICSAWVNNLFVLFLPDLQTSEGPFMEEICSDGGPSKPWGWREEMGGER